MVGIVANLGIHGLAQRIANYFLDGAMQINQKITDLVRRFAHQKSEFRKSAPCLARLEFNSTSFPPEPFVVDSDSR